MMPRMTPTGGDSAPTLSHSRCRVSFPVLTRVRPNEQAWCPRSVRMQPDQRLTTRLFGGDALISSGQCARTSPRGGVGNVLLQVYWSLQKEGLYMFVRGDNL